VVAPSPQVATPSQLLPLPTPKGGVGRALQTAQASTLLLGLAAAVLIFLGVQGRLDRRDPRLARAPIEERLDFEDFR
jgi:hypothetical protein